MRGKVPRPIRESDGWIWSISSRRRNVKPMHNAHPQVLATQTAGPPTDLKAPPVRPYEYWGSTILV